MTDATQRPPARPTARFDEAFAFAMSLHRAHFRKGTGIPYVSHLMSVSALVMEYGGDEDAAIAALLHDAIEDQAEHWPGGAASLRAEIGRRFGPTVLAIVNACTDAEVAPKPPWRARKEAYIRHLLDSESHDARLVSAADKLHNARCILADYRVLKSSLWGRFNQEAQDAGSQLWYYESLVAAFKEVGPGAIAEELARTVAELRQLVTALEGVLPAA